MFVYVFTKAFNVTQRTTFIVLKQGVKPKQALLYLWSCIILTYKICKFLSIWVFFKWKK